VQSHSHPQRDAVGPRLRGQRPLRGYGRCDRIAGPRERDEEGVALRVDLVALELLERRSEQASVRRQDVAVALAELPQQPRRPLDIGEEERDRSGRAVSHVVTAP
jgi:hypothetical protein